MHWAETGQDEFIAGEAEGRGAGRLEGTAPLAHMLPGCSRESPPPPKRGWQELRGGSQGGRKGGAPRGARDKAELRGEKGSWCQRRGQVRGEGKLSRRGPQ